MTLFTRSKTLAVLLLVAVFLAGGISGWALGSRASMPHPGGRGPDAMAAFLTHRLHLSDTQRDSVRAIFARHDPEMRAILGDVRPRMDSLRAVLHAEIAAQLTPAQREEHARLMAELEHHRQRERRDSTMPKEGPH
jgi:heavy-metal resistance protein